MWGRVGVSVLVCIPEPRGGFVERGFAQEDL